MSIIAIVLQLNTLSSISSENKVECSDMSKVLTALSLVLAILDRRSGMLIRAYFIFAVILFINCFFWWCFLLFCFWEKEKILQEQASEIQEKVAESVEKNADTNATGTKKMYI